MPELSTNSKLHFGVVAASVQEQRFVGSHVDAQGFNVSAMAREDGVGEVILHTTVAQETGVLSWS